MLIIYGHLVSLRSFDKQFDGRNFGFGQTGHPQFFLRYYRATMLIVPAENIINEIMVKNRKTNCLPVLQHTPILIVKAKQAFYVIEIVIIPVKGSVFFKQLCK